LLFFRTPWAKYNGHEDIDNRRMSKNDFDDKARTKVVFDKEGYSQNGVQDKALTKRLIVTYD